MRLVQCLLAGRYHLYRMGASGSRDKSRIGDEPQILHRSRHPPYIDVYCGRKGITRLSGRYGIGLIQLSTQLGVIMEIRGRRPAFIRVHPIIGLGADLESAANHLLSVAQEMYGGSSVHQTGGAAQQYQPPPVPSVAPAPPPRQDDASQGRKRTRAFVIVDWRQPTLHSRLLSSAVGLKGGGMVDVKKVRDLIEDGSRGRRKVVARLVVGRSPGGWLDRVWRIWRRVGYITAVDDALLQVDLGTPLVVATIQRAAWTALRRPRVLIIVAGDGNLEHGSGVEASIRMALDSGCRLEVWAWKACVPALYETLQASYPSLIDIFHLDPYASWLRYDRGAAGQHGGGAASGGGGKAEGAGIPVATEVMGGAEATPLPPTTMPPPPQEATVMQLQGGAGGTMPPSKPCPMAGWATEGTTQAPAQPPQGPSTEQHHEEGADSDEGEGDEENEDAAHLEQWQQEHEKRQQEETQPGPPVEEEEEPPEPFLDPLTMELMSDPVMAPSGRTYERTTIVQEIALRGREPFTQEPLAEADLRPNRALKELIEMYLSRKMS